MKKLAIALVLGCLFQGQALWAGACETNATSLQRIFDRKCKIKSTQNECTACTDEQFNKVISKIETCRNELETMMAQFRASSCDTKPQQ